MFGLDINIWAVLVAAAVGFMIGGAWYSASPFGPIFRAEVAKLGTPAGDLRTSLIVSGITQIVTALVLATILSYVGVSGAAQGAVIGLQLGIGIVLPFAAKGAPFEGRSWTLVALNTGEHIIGLAAMGAILGAWQ